MTDWTIDARRRIDAGESIAQVARDLGRSTDGVRYALNIGGARDLKRKRVAASRLRERAERVGVKPKATGQKLKVVKNEERMIANAYADKPAPGRPRISLPVISLPDLPTELDAKPQIKLAPTPRITVNEGAERIRRIHQRMLRRGMLAERGLVEEFGL